MCSSVWHCVCCSYPTSGATPWLECVYASGHVFMSTQHAMLAQPPMDSYMETWVLMCVTVSVRITLFVVPNLD